jgi:hypothetical protein
MYVGGSALYVGGSILYISRVKADDSAKPSDRLHPIDNCGRVWNNY